MIEDTRVIHTADGAMATFVCKPERGEPRPGVILFMDAPGIREELRGMARRLAAVGYEVALPNLYYRQGVEELGDFLGEAGAGARARMMTLMASLTAPMVLADTQALIAELDAPIAAEGRERFWGAVGYCMSGRYAINAAVGRPDRFKAAASIYGVSLATEEADSPHLAIGRVGARLYFGCAENDSYAPMAMVERLMASAERAEGCEVEVYPGTHHGFAFPERPAYDRAAAERHWERLFELFGAALPQA